MPKKYWENTPQYKRILEILDDYWLTEPDEFRVRVRLDFIKSNGETQSKQLLWQNPNYTCDQDHESRLPRSFADLMGKSFKEIDLEADERFWNAGNIRRREL